jgi:hypothetical protein
MENKEDAFPVVLMQISRSDISAAISMFEEDEVEELAKIVWDTVLVGKLVDTIRETLVPYYNEGSLLRMAIKKVVEDKVAEIDEKHKFRGGVKRFLIYKKIGRI